MYETRAKEVINYLTGLDLSGLSIEFIKNFLIKNVANLNETYVSSSYKYDTKNSFYRSSKIRKEIKGTNLSDIIYPPIERVGLGRVNRPKKPVLYTSTSNRTAIVEGRYKLDDELLLSEWEIKPNQFIIPTIVGYFGGIDKRKENEKLFNKIKENANHLGLNEIEVFRSGVISNLFSPIFTNNSSDVNIYKISIAISEILGFDSVGNNSFYNLFTGHRCGNISQSESILFPSIADFGNDSNLAIRPNAFLTKFQLTSVRHIKLKSIYPNFHFEELNFANSINNKGELLWKGRKGLPFIPPGVEINYKLTEYNTFEIERVDEKKFYYY